MPPSPNPLITNPIPPGVMAPAESVRKATETRPPDPKVWVDFLRQTTEKFGLEDKDLDWRIYARFVTVEKFVQGEQFGRVSRLDGSWRARPRKEGDPRYVHNWLRGHSRTILAQWTLAQGEFNVIALPDGDAPDQNEGAARNAKAILEHYQRTLLTEDFKQREGMLAQTTGQMWRYSYWDANAGGTAKRAKYEDEDVPSPGTFTCADCGQSGSEEELGNDSAVLGMGGGNANNATSAGSQGMASQSTQPAITSSGRNGFNQPPSSGPPRFPNPSDRGRDTMGAAALGTDSGYGANVQPTLCPACGSPNLSLEPGQSFSLPKLSGEDEVNTGDLVCLPVPGYQVKCDRLPVRVRDSLWLRWRQYVRHETVKEAIPNWKKEPTGSNEDDWGLRAEMTAKRSSGNMEASQSRLYGQTGHKTDADLVAIDRWWFRPAIYKDVVLRADLELANGETIPAGTVAGDAFPDGLYVLMVNGEPLDFRSEDFRDHWQHTPAMLLPSRIDGDGLLDDLIEPQKEVNDIKGLMLSNIKHVSGAGLMYRSEYLERQDISGKPYELVPIKPGADPAMRLVDMVAAIPRPELSQGVFAYLQQLQPEMQSMAASYPSSTGEGDPDQKTASGAHLLSQNAQSQRAPELALRAAGDVETAMQWLKLWQKNATDEMYIPFQGKVGQLDGQWFKGSDLPKTFVVTMRPRSYIPKSENDRRNDFMGLLNAFQGIEGLMAAMQAAPDLVREACDRFNVSVDFGNVNLAHQVARLRIEAMKAMMPQAQASAQAVGQPQMAVMALVSAPDTAVDADDPHEQMLEFYKKWKLEDEGLEARKKNQLLYAAVDAQIANHKQAMVEVEQEKAQMQLAAQAPMIQQQQQMQQEQVAQQQQGEQAQSEAQAGQQQQQAAMDAQQQGQQADQQAQTQQIQMAQQEAAAQAQRDHDMQLAQMQAQHQADEGDRQHQRALELEKLKQEGVMAAAKAKPKGAEK